MPPEAEQLSEMLRMLDLRADHLARLIDQEVASAKEHSAQGRRKEALMCMKQKRVHETQREQLATQRLNLMQQEATLQALRFNSLVVETTAGVSAAIEREIKKVRGVEGVEAAYDKMDDLLADGKDILDATSRPMGEAAGFDDDELYKELEQMELADVKATLASTSGAAANEDAEDAAALDALLSGAQPIPHHQPDTSSGKQKATAVRAAEEREERELAELAQLSMSMDAMPMPRMAACF